MVLTVAAQGREAMAGDEDEGGGAVRSSTKEMLRGSSGKMDARTRLAVMRRCRRCRRRDRRELDGGGIGG